MLVRRFATILGAFLLIEGAWGLFSPVVFGVLTTNVTHAVIHIALGAVGIWAGRNAHARNYLLGVGGLLLVVGVLHFIPGASEMVTSILAVNRAVAYVNILVGVAAVAIALRTPAETIPSA